MNMDVFIGLTILIFVVIVMSLLVMWCRNIINRLDGKVSLTAREIIKGRNDDA